jgi:hypothetical protein
LYREIDEKIEVLRVRLKNDAEARMVARRRSWHQTTASLEHRARDAARQEIEQLKRELQQEEEAISQQIERTCLTLFSFSSVADPDPGSGKKLRSGSGMNNPHHISESL